MDPELFLAIGTKIVDDKPTGTGSSSGGGEVVLLTQNESLTGRVVPALKSWQTEQQDQSSVLKANERRGSFDIDFALE